MLLVKDLHAYYGRAQKVRDCHARDFAWILESQEKPAPGTFIGVELEKIFFVHHHLAPGDLVVGMTGQDLGERAFP